MDGSDGRGETDSGDGSRLEPYVSQLVLEWLRETPDASWRQIDGTLAFVDVSGFTRLTERLARQGKVGAEQISDTLDAALTLLLDVAGSYGGQLVKWAGDAVLLLYRGPCHVEAACRSVAEMRGALRAVRPDPSDTGAAGVSLRVSAGVHTGVVHCFLVGSLHRELLVVGPAATATALAESTAKAGEVVVSQATADLLDARLLGARREHGVVLAKPPTVALAAPAGAPARPLPRLAESELAAAVSVRVREHLETGGGEGEHRQVAVAFVELTGVAGLLAGAGPDAAQAALAQVVRTTQEVAERHQVTFVETDVAVDGGKIMLAAGAPRTSGHDEERILRAVREVVDLEDTAGGLRLRAGVNTGRVFAGEFGPPRSRTYSVKGDAVNVAARLVARAALGEVVATTAVVDRCPGLFVTERIEPFLVKGKSDAIHAVRVGRPVGGAAGGRAAVARSHPFVGRSAELASLASALAGARAGHGSVVAVEGPAGIGKTRLVDELVSRCAGVRALVVACDEYEASTPYSSVRPVLAELLGLAGQAVPVTVPRLRRAVETRAPDLLPWLPLVATPFDLQVPETAETAPLEGRLRKQRLERVLVDLMSAVADQPVVLTLDDAHHMDEASVDLVAELAGRVDGLPWLVVVLRQPGPDGLHVGGTRMELAPLPDADAAELLAVATEDHPLPPHELTGLAGQGQGNPLFLTELAAAAQQIGSARDLPSSLEELLAAQIDRLPPPDRRLLRVAAVLGNRVDPGLLTVTLPSDVPPPDEAAWVRLADFLQPEGVAYRFRHQLCRDVAYEGLPYRRRRVLHGRAGDAIAGQPVRTTAEAALLSLHYFHAQRFDAAWRWSRTAGGHAQEIYANAEAADLFERALESGRHVDGVPGGDLSAVAEALGDVRERLGEFAKSDAAYVLARRYARSDPVVLGRLHIKSGLVAARSGNYTRGLRRLGRAGQAINRAGECPAAAEVAARRNVEYAFMLQRQGRGDRAAVWARRAIVQAEACGERRVLAQALFVLDWAEAVRGIPTDHSAARRSLAVWEELGDLSWQARLQNYLGGRAYFAGRWDEALDLYGQARAAWERTGDQWLAQFATCNIAEILCDQGRLGEAEAMLRTALRVWRASGAIGEIAFGTGLAARISWRRGRWVEAMRQFGEARAAYVEEGEQAEVVQTDARVAECLVAQGRAAEALALADDSLARAGGPDGGVAEVPLLLRTIGYARAQQGEVEAAWAALDAGLRAARGRGAEHEVAFTLDALDRLGRASGRVSTGAAAERDAIFERLGIDNPPSIAVTSAAR